MSSVGVEAAIAAVTLPVLPPVLLPVLPPVLQAISYGRVTASIMIITAAPWHQLLMIWPIKYYCTQPDMN